MRIISKFKDYYDIGTSLGIDKTQVFVRKNKILTVAQLPEEVKTKLCKKVNNKYWTPNWLKDWRITASVRAKLILVIVAGKSYPCIKMYASFDSTTYCYNEHDIITALKHYKAEELVNNPKGCPYWGRSPYNSMVKALAAKYPTTTNMHILLDTPVFLIEAKERRWQESTRSYSEEEVLEINPILKDLEFYRVLDSYTAYQEINMFKFGVMPDNKDVPQTIPDKYIRDAKGFDDMSFKKRK